MSFGPYVETGIGLGVLTLRGDDSVSRPLFALPLLIHPVKHLGIEFRPAWARGVNDYDIALMCHIRHASVKLGYRWVRSPNESLDGPYTGISLRW